MIFLASFTMHSCVGSSYTPHYEEPIYETQEPFDPLSRSVEDPLADPGFEDNSVEFPEENEVVNNAMKTIEALESAKNDNVIYGSSLEERIQIFKKSLMMFIKLKSNTSIGIYYDKILEKHPNAEGKITIKFVIGEGYLYLSGKKTNIKKSKVLTAHVEQDTVRSSELSSYIIDRVKKDINSYMSPPGGQKVTITYPWIFKKLGGGYVAGNPTPTGRLKKSIFVGSGFVGYEGAPEVSGGLSQEEVSGVIRSQHNAIRHCYEKILQKQPNAAGKVTMRFVIGAHGRVLTSNVKQDSIRSSDLNSCIIARIKTWKFPKPSGVQKVTITYPWVFKKQ